MFVFYTLAKVPLSLVGTLMDSAYSAFSNQRGCNRRYNEKLKMFIKCFHCGGPHYKRDCPKLNGTKKYEKTYRHYP